MATTNNKKCYTCTGVQLCIQVLLTIKRKSKTEPFLAVEAIQTISNESDRVPITKFTTIHTQLVCLFRLWYDTTDEPPDNIVSDCVTTSTVRRKLRHVDVFPCFWEVLSDYLWAPHISFPEGGCDEEWQENTQHVLTARCLVFLWLLYSVSFEWRLHDSVSTPDRRFYLGSTCPRFCSPTGSRCHNAIVAAADINAEECMFEATMVVGWLVGWLVS